MKPRPITWPERVGVVLAGLLVVDVVVFFVSYGQLPGEGEPNPAPWGWLAAGSGIAFPVIVLLVVAVAVLGRRRRST